MEQKQFSKPCKEWAGSRFKNGYGQWAIGSRTRSTRLAHRVVFMAVHGPIARTVDVMHLCHNKACIEISHLQAGTRSENMRMSAHVISAGCRKLTDAQIVEILRRSELGETRTALAREFGVSQPTVSNIVNRRYTFIPPKQIYSDLDSTQTT